MSLLPLRCFSPVRLRVQHLRDGIIQAEAYTRKGELGEAFWSYLSVLETNPDNNTARRQVGKVVTAVRQFDLMPPARRLLRRMRFHRWMGLISEVFARTLCPHRAMDQGVRFDFKRTNLQQGAGSEQRAEGLAAEKSGSGLGRTDAEGLRRGRRTEEDIGPPRNR